MHTKDIVRPIVAIVIIVLLGLLFAGCGDRSTSRVAFETAAELCKDHDGFTWLREDSHAADAAFSMSVTVRCSDGTKIESPRYRVDRQ